MPTPELLITVYFSLDALFIFLIIAIPFLWFPAQLFHRLTISSAISIAAATLFYFLLHDSIGNRFLTGEQTAPIFCTFSLLFWILIFCSKKERKTGLIVLIILGLLNVIFLWFVGWQDPLAGFMLILATSAIGLVPGGIVALLLQIPFRWWIKDSQKQCAIYGILLALLYSFAFRWFCFLSTQ